MPTQSIVKRHFYLASKIVHSSYSSPQTNTARDFVAAARLAEPFVDAVDLNLGCPQRDARLGHFGSYLLGREDWPVVAEMVREASRVLAIPICICLSGGAANDGNGGNDDGPLRSDCWGGSENRGMLISG